MRDPSGMVQKGYSTSRNGLFRISTLQGEYVLVTDRHKVAEYLKAPDAILNAQEGANDVTSSPPPEVGKS